MSPDWDVHSWALGKVDVLGPAVGEKAIDAGTTTMSHKQLDCALELMRCLLPQKIQKNLSNLMYLVLLSSVDQ